MRFAEAYDKLRTALKRAAPNHDANDLTTHIRELFQMSGPFEIYADEFRKIIGNSPELTLLSSDLVFAEGVCWLPSRNYVIVSDFPNNRIMKWDETSGLGIFRQPSDCANGNTVDAEGRVLSCLTRGRTVVRLEHDGTLAPVADRYMGGKLTSPNDVVVKSDGSIWFTDPDYGFLHPEFGHGDKPEQDRNRVFRVDGDTMDITVVSEDFDKPNGIAFSPDESVLYIGDTGKNPRRVPQPPHRAFDVTPGRIASQRPSLRHSNPECPTVPMRHRRKPLRLRGRRDPSLQPPPAT